MLCLGVNDKEGIPECTLACAMQHALALAVALSRDTGSHPESPLMAIHPSFEDGRKPETITAICHTPAALRLQVL